MVRLGVMSDLAIKSAFPEFQAPNVALASAMDMVVLQKHELTGMKLPKGFTGKRISRFPINDIANYSSLSNVDNVSKTVYASTQGYRKKLGSSNIDREDRQSTGKFKLTERMNPMKYSENFELKRRGGYVDLINADSSISQEDIVSYLKQVKQKDITFMNKQVRDSQVGLAKVESNLNSAVLSNLENAKANAIMQNENKYINRKQKIEQFGQAAGLDAAQIAILQTRMKIFQTVEIGKIQEEANKIKTQTSQLIQLGGNSIQIKIQKAAQKAGFDATQLSILQNNLSSNPKPTQAEIDAEIKNILTPPPPPPQTQTPPPPQTQTPPPPQTQAPAPAAAPAAAPTAAPTPAAALTQNQIAQQKMNMTKINKQADKSGLNATQKATLQAIFSSDTKDVYVKQIKDEIKKIKSTSATAPVINKTSYEMSSDIIARVKRDIDPSLTISQQNDLFIMLNKYINDVGKNPDNTKIQNMLQSVQTSAPAPTYAPAHAPAYAPAHAPTPDDLTHYYDTERNMAIEEHLPPHYNSHYD